ncbi:hypothetical protein [Brachybacterium sp. UMB0905]|uniref:hypothetical protein n=1 Tax=Brachybacterium sp. UMB0905 TaxID=2069310 RepID=UPI0011AF64A4|nr:hypothetical protein [Brachybacterium sp. UMB0905]
MSGEFMGADTASLRTFAKAVRDQYDWDGGKRTTIDLPGPFDPTITDQQLAELHRAGLAMEFLLHGSTTRQVSGP